MKRTREVSRETSPKKTGNQEPTVRMPETNGFLAIQQATPALRDNRPFRAPRFGGGAENQLLVVSILKTASV